MCNNVIFTNHYISMALSPCRNQCGIHCFSYYRLCYKLCHKFFFEKDFESKYKGFRTEEELPLKQQGLIQKLNEDKRGFMVQRSLK